MAETYQAILKGDRLEWTGEPPGPEIEGRPVAVAIVGAASTEPMDLEIRRRRALEALERLAARGTFAEGLVVIDPPKGA